MTPLIVVPTRREAAGGERCFVAGVGAAAGDALRARLREARPGVVIHTGFCGALDPSLRAGDLVLVRRVEREGQPPLEPALHLLEASRKELRRRGLRFVTSGILTVDAPAGQRRKLAYWNARGTAGIDMESAHVAAACEEAGVPWIAVRAVVDTARQSLPAAVRRWRAEADERAVVRAALVRPWDWPAYARLAWQARLAARALERGLPCMLAGAAAPPPDELLPLV